MTEKQVVGTRYDLLTLVRMCQIIGDKEKHALEMHALSCPEISMQRLLVDEGIVSEATLTSLELGQTLIENGTIKETQFCVGMFDEITAGVPMTESLRARGWLPTDWTPEQIKTGC